ncbi:MAG: FAD-binding and (Fe-S)-binding domain-containing protein [Syntrophobacteraceae bacterium]
MRGPVRFDRMSRLLYSTDASSYQVMPVGVVLPLDIDDLSAAVSVAAAHKVPIIPRGGGTSLSGQTVGTALVLDLSRHLNRILEINPDERWVRVEAGAVLDHVNGALFRHGLMIGPDPSSSPSATLGGMTGNNSTGAHSIVYGMMVDHVREAGVVLPDGSRARFSPCSADTAAAMAGTASLEGRLYRHVPDLLSRNRDTIASGYPPVWRNVAGYNLNRMLHDRDAMRPFNLTPLIVGSEGTLATITDVTVGLVERPERSRLAIVHFDSLRESLEAVPGILESRPASIELMDRFFIQLTRRSPDFGPRLHFILGDPQIILIVEFAGHDERELADRAATMEAILRREGYHGEIVHQTEPSEVDNVWIARKASFGLLLSQRGDAKPLAFADDAVVPIERLPEFALEAERICREAGTEPSFSAHVSAGCLHIMPLVNLKSQRGLDQMRTISQGIARLAIRLGGTTTGEHGEGFARSHYNEELYGPALHHAFKELKAIFDPANLMNPGKIVNAPTPWDPRLLRFHPGYSTPLVPGETFFDFSADGGFAGAVEMCNGQGLCRKRESGVMCPSYMVTGEEAHSTRGRANALRAAITGRLDVGGMTERELFEVMDLCVQCKACRGECPSGVDMAKLKSEFLAHHHAAHGISLRDWFFGHTATLSRLGARFPGLANRVLSNPGIRRLLEHTLQIDRRRPFPPFAPQSFQAWLHARKSSGNGVKRTAPQGPVVLWDDIYLSHNEPELGRAAVRVLEAAGFDVRVIAGRHCEGRPLISKGLLTEARRDARHNVALLDPIAARSIPIVGVEPSAVAAFRDEYPDLLRSKAARRVSRQTVMIEELLARLADERRLDLPLKGFPHPRRILVHGHCHQKAVSGTGPLLRMLNLIPNAAIEEIPSGCCGMAGAFGFEHEHYDLSIAMGEDRLFPTVRGAPPDALIAAAGFSCRHHIAHGTGRQVMHPLVILAEALEDS